MVNPGELLAAAVVGYVGWQAWKAVKGAPQAAGRRARRPTPVKQPVKQLVLDPQCNTYVPEDAAERLSIGGRIVYFCGPECREAYLKRNRGDD
ncbi:MAG: hypothetical protein V2A77_04580 [Pseudomonadota bacterium]